MTESELFEIAKKHNLIQTKGRSIGFDFRVEHPLFGTTRPILFSYSKWNDGRRWIYLYELLMRKANQPDKYDTMVGRHINRHEISADILDHIINDRKRRFDEIFLAETAQQIHNSGSVLVTELDKLAAEV